MKRLKEKVPGSNLRPISGFTVQLLLVLLEVVEDGLDDGDDGDALRGGVLVVDAAHAVLADDHLQWKQNKKPFILVSSFYVLQFETV